MKKDKRLEEKTYIENMKKKVEDLGFKFTENPKYGWQVFFPLFVSSYNRGRQT